MLVTCEDCSFVMVAKRPKLKALGFTVQVLWDGSELWFCPRCSQIRKEARQAVDAASKESVH